MVTRALGDFAGVAQPGDISARRRVLLEELAHAGADRARQRLLVAGAGQFRRFVGVGDKPGFHQDRRDVRRLQHHEPGLFHTLFMQRRHATDIAQHFLPDVKTGSQRGRHRQVEQHPGKHLVLVIKGNVAGPADQV